jgi:hypothetical protein
MIKNLLTMISCAMLGIMSLSTVTSTPARSQISDRDAAALALGAAAIIAGAAIVSQNRRKERHYHHYHPVPSYPNPYYRSVPTYPPPLRYRYYEPAPAPSPYYHHPYRRHWN